LFYSLRSLMILAILGPPLLAGGWFGYRWLHPPFVGLPPALNFSEEERRELARYLNEMPRGKALFDPNGPPEAMRTSQTPIP
jgi:hypothetical protein